MRLERKVRLGKDSMMRHLHWLQVGSGLECRLQ